MLPYNCLGLSILTSTTIMVPLIATELSGKRKTSVIIIFIFGIRSIHYGCFVECRFTSKVLGIGAAENYWGGVKAMKYGKIYAISSDV